MKIARNQLEAAVNLQLFFSLMFNLMPLDFSVHTSKNNSLEKKDAVWHIGGLNTNLIQMSFNNMHLLGKNLPGETKICYSLCQALPAWRSPGIPHETQQHTKPNHPSAERKEFDSKAYYNIHVQTYKFKFISY